MFLPSNVVNDWGALRDEHEIVYLPSMQWIHNPRLNYSCEPTAKKGNASYALTVPMNTTMNSTVYDIDKHSQMEIEFMVYNNSHPCDNEFECTPSAIWASYLFQNPHRAIHASHHTPAMDVPSLRLQLDVLLRRGNRYPPKAM